jgi:three-Cys-motif partner protein
MRMRPATAPRGQALVLRRWIVIASPARVNLNGWYPKLGTWARRVLYVDTHAGRGRYESGDAGSPVLALQTLLRHSYREKLLNASEFNFLFIERDPANRAALEAELSQLKPFPARVNVETSAPRSI